MIDMMKDINKISYDVIGGAFKVHSELGPGLLESTYEVCLQHELMKKGHRVDRQRTLPVIYDGRKLDAGYRIDLLVDDLLVVEIKSVDCLAPVHTAQVLTYLKLMKLKIGLIINFNVANLQKGIKRLIKS